MSDGGRILVVEDDELLRETLSEVLSDEGHDVRAAANGADALHQLDRHQPDLIVLDLMMPVMDGFAFREAQRSRGVALEVPLLVLSAVRDLDAAGHRLGAAAWMTKPFRLDEVLATVSRLLDGNGTGADRPH